MPKFTKYTLFAVGLSSQGCSVAFRRVGGQICLCSRCVWWGRGGGGFSLLEALDLGIDRVNASVAADEVLVDGGPVAHLLSAGRVHERDGGLLIVLVRGADRADHDGLAVAAQRVLQQVRQLAVAVRHGRQRRQCTIVGLAALNHAVLLLLDRRVLR